MANLPIEPRWVNGIYQLETTDPVMGGADGVDNLQAKQLGCRTEWLKQKNEETDGEIEQIQTNYAPINSPHLTGIPTAPTAGQNVNNTQIATTQFVKTAIAHLVGSAPAALDTLSELATALGGDRNLKATLLNLIAQKANQSDFLAFKHQFIGIPFPYSLIQVPENWLAFHGQAFNKSAYPELAKKYPSGRLPDLRGEFIRGWDNGRGVDSHRQLLSWQEDRFKTHFHFLPTANGNNDKLEDGITSVIYDGSPTLESGKWVRTSTLPDNIKYGNNNGIYRDAANRTYSSNIATHNHYSDSTYPRNITFNYICLAR